ncbi:hypothetical protein B0H14DRAFT_1318432 [Mycena olivaceomarginata]|nr:hypothetical protein B0H14DRAFT_1318432 [Mycena olivaceomarginata]
MRTHAGSLALLLWLALRSYSASAPTPNAYSAHGALATAASRSYALDDITGRSLVHKEHVNAACMAGSRTFPLTTPCATMPSVRSRATSGVSGLSRRRPGRCLQGTRSEGAERVVDLVLAFPAIAISPSRTSGCRF